MLRGLLPTKTLTMEMQVGSVLRLVPGPTPLPEKGSEKCHVPLAIITNTYNGTMSRMGMCAGEAHHE